MTDPEVPPAKTSVESLVIPMVLRFPDPFVQTFVVKGVEVMSVKIPVAFIKLQFVPEMLVDQIPDALLKLLVDPFITNETLLKSPV